MIKFILCIATFYMGILTSAFALDEPALENVTDTLSEDSLNVLIRELAAGAPLSRIRRASRKSP
jgi:hypothetical protein